MQAADAVPRPVQHTSLDAHALQLGNVWGDACTPASTTVLTSPRFCAARASLQASLADSWSAAEAFVGRFAAERAISVFAEAWSLDGFRAAMSEWPLAAVPRSMRCEVHLVLCRYAQP